MTEEEKEKYVADTNKMFDLEILRTLIERARVKLIRAINAEEKSSAPNVQRIAALEKESDRLDELSPNSAEEITAALATLKNYIVPQSA